MPQRLLLAKIISQKKSRIKFKKKIISISRNFYILLLTKSWIGISQRKSGCQESAVDRGWGRSFRHLDGIWGQLYNWELSCTLAFGGNELMVTRLIGTKSFANTHWSSILKLWKLDYRYEIFFMVIPIITFLVLKNST